MCCSRFIVSASVRPGPLYFTAHLVQGSHSVSDSFSTQQSRYPVTTRISEMKRICQLWNLSCIGKFSHNSFRLIRYLHATTIGLVCFVWALASAHVQEMCSVAKRIAGLIPSLKAYQRSTIAGGSQAAQNSNASPAACLLYNPAQIT